VAALALTVASTSAALLIRVGQFETAADQAMLDALRQSPGRLMTRTRGLRDDPLLLFKA